MWIIGFATREISLVEVETPTASPFAAVKACLAEFPEAYTYSSAFPGFELDEAPQGLKPIL